MRSKHGSTGTQGCRLKLASDRAFRLWHQLERGEISRKQLIRLTKPIQDEISPGPSKPRSKRSQPPHAGDDPMFQPASHRRNKAEGEGLAMVERHGRDGGTRFRPEEGSWSKMSSGSERKHPDAMLFLLTRWDLWTLPLFGLASLPAMHIGPSITLIWTVMAISISNFIINFLFFLYISSPDDSTIFCVIALAFHDRILSRRPGAHPFPGPCPSFPNQCRYSSLSFSGRRGPTRRGSD